MIENTKVSQKEVERFLVCVNANHRALRRVGLVVVGFISEFPDLEDGEPSPGDMAIYFLKTKVPYEVSY